MRLSRRAAALVTLACAAIGALMLTASAGSATQTQRYDISKLAGKFMPVTVVDRFQHFVGFFQRVRLDGIERLLAIPRATAGRAQPFHDLHRSFEAFSSSGHAALQCK